VPQPLPGGISKKLLVVGDGVAGKAAAEGAREAGSEVAVLDKGRRIVKTEGQPGLFDVTVGDETMRVGAMASPDVITNAQFEEMKAAGRFARPSDGKAPKSVLFVQCAGSRDANHLPYCSTACCPTTLRHAAYIRQSRRARRRRST
jgi:heterodisulfide reductase subunit A-like polyferredoxin